MNSQIRHHFIADVTLALGIIVAIFGSSLAVSSQNRDFTTRAALISGDRLLFAVQDLGEEVLFDAGWTGHADTVADALGIELKPTSKTNTSVLAQLLSPVEPVPPEADYQYGRNLANTPWGNLPENDVVRPRVAGAMDVAEDQTNGESVNELMSDELEGGSEDQMTGESVNELMSDELEGVAGGFVTSPNLPDGRVVVGYRPGAGIHVDEVRFYLNDALVTTDTSAPYFLGGDVLGKPRGYTLEGAGEYRLRVEVRNGDGVVDEAGETLGR